VRQAVFLYSPELWSRGHGPQHPLKPERLKRTFDLLSEYGAFQAGNVDLIEPRPATEAELALFHTRDYIQAVKTLSAGGARDGAWRYGFGPGDNPIFEGMFETEALKAGGALQAAQLLLDGSCQVAFNFGGGLHHAGAGVASGFCVFNDPAVAIHWLVQQGQRVAYVDIDVHHGDGVQAAFYHSDQVLTISLHQDPRTLFPGTGYAHEIGEGAGRGYSVNLPLPPGTNDEIYLQAFQAVVPPMLERFGADVVVTQLGTDTHYLDPLASLTLTTHGHLALYEELERLSPRWLALGGGGYAIDVVPRSWTLAFGVMSGQQWPAELPSSYRANFGGAFLHDLERPELNADLRGQISQATEAMVAEVRRLHEIG
jgi:acetoin utilization protein AcuC